MSPRGSLADGQISPEYQIAPRLTARAPHIAPLSWASPKAYNTEWRKGVRFTGDLELDCRGMTGECIVAVIYNYPARAVHTFARSLGCDPRGSKDDVLRQIKGRDRRGQRGSQQGVLKGNRRFWRLDIALLPPLDFVRRDAHPPLRRAAKPRRPYILDAAPSECTYR